MKLTDEQLNDFIAKFKSVYGEELSRSEALAEATALVSLVKRAYKPMSKKDFEKYKFL